MSETRRKYDLTGDEYMGREEVEGLNGSHVCARHEALRGSALPGSG